MADGLDLHRLGDLLLGGGQHGPTADFGLEQRVHQSRLAQAALSCKRKHTVSECESKRHTHTHAEAVTGCRYLSAQTLGAAAQTRRCRDRLAAVKRLEKICDVPAGAASLCGADRKKNPRALTRRFV